jgi:lysophospholipase L1-like esterase
MRRLVVRGLAILIVLAVGELGVRVVAVFSVGPRVLLYGTPWYRAHVEPPAGMRGIEFHALEGDGYTKYFPHEEKWANDSRGHYRVRINDHGLRGPDFDDQKRPGVRRVLTLGASSTFGFENRDDETYPYYLQKVLDRTAGRGHFEVINFAVPHADTDAIVSMFVAEGVPLSPDVVTVYEGVNDSERAVFDELYGTTWRASGESHFLTVTLLRKLAEAILPKPARVTVTQAMIDAGTRRYLRNLDAIVAACRPIAARPIVVTQQARSYMVEQDRLHGLTYEEEARIVSTALDAPDASTKFNAMQLSLGAMFVVHSHLTPAVRDWARTHDVPLVDGVAVLDRERDLVRTWVHLAPSANKALAKAIAAKILDVTGR